MYEEYEEIDGCGEGGWDWTELKFLRKKDTGELFLGYNSGCSCTWFWDDPELTPVANWQEAVEVAKTYVTEYGIRMEDVYEMANRLAQNF